MCMDPGPPTIGMVWYSLMGEWENIYIILIIELWLQKLEESYDWLRIDNSINSNFSLDCRKKSAAKYTSP